MLVVYFQDKSNKSIWKIILSSVSASESWLLSYGFFEGRAFFLWTLTLGEPGSGQVGHFCIVVTRKKRVFKERDLLETDTHIAKPQCTSPRPQMPTAARTEPRARNSIWVSHLTGTSPDSWVILPSAEAH